MNPNKQTNYIIAISPDAENFQQSLIEAKEYINTASLPKVVIFSETYKNEDFPKIPYSQVQTFKNDIRIVDKKDESNDFEVIKKISSLLKNGMILIDSNIAYDDEVAKLLLSVSNRGQDYVINRNVITLLDAEIDYISGEFIKIAEHIANPDKTGYYKPKKNIIFRFHDYPDFPFNTETLARLNEAFGEVHGYSIMLAYFIARKKTILLKQDLERVCKEEGEEMTEFINPSEHERQMKNYTHYNILSAEIVDKDVDFVKECSNELIRIFQQTNN